MNTWDEIGKNLYPMYKKNMISNIDAGYAHKYKTEEELRTHMKKKTINGVCSNAMNATRKI